MDAPVPRGLLYAPVYVQISRGLMETSYAVQLRRGLDQGCQGQPDLSADKQGDSSNLRGRYPYTVGPLRNRGQTPASQKSLRAQIFEIGAESNFQTSLCH